MVCSGPPYPSVSALLGVEPSQTNGPGHSECRVIAFPGPVERLRRAAARWEAAQARKGLSGQKNGPSHEDWGDVSDHEC